MTNRGAEVPGSGPPSSCRRPVTEEIEDPRHCRATVAWLAAKDSVPPRWSTLPARRRRPRTPDSDLLETNAADHGDLGPGLLRRWPRPGTTAGRGGDPFAAAVRLEPRADGRLRLTEHPVGRGDAQTVGACSRPPAHFRRLAMLQPAEQGERILHSPRLRRAAAESADSAPAGQ